MLSNATLQTTIFKIQALIYQNIALKQWMNVFQKCLQTQSKSFAFIFTAVIVRKAGWYILQFFYIWSRCSISRSINGPFGNFCFDIWASALSSHWHWHWHRHCKKFVLQKQNLYALSFSFLASISSWNAVPLCYKCLFLQPSISYFSTIGVHCYSRIKAVWIFGSTCPLTFRKNRAPKTF